MSRTPFPCRRCGGPKPSGKGRRVCDNCSPLDAIWPQLQESPAGCWLWPGRTNDGYGRYGEKLIHRMVYESMVCDIPDGLDLDHLCLVINCVNPYHLDPVPRAENNRRKWALYTHCKHGHEFTPVNTRVWRDTRFCRTCSADRSTASYQRRKERVT